MSSLKLGNPAQEPDVDAQLVVDDSIFIESPTTGGGTVLVSGLGYVTLQSSDLRLKENVVPNPHGLEAVLAMETIEFDWKKHGNHDIGFSAQNMVEIIPEACPVDEHSKGDYMSFRELPVMAAMVKAIQELNAKIEALGG
jgi:hypothetical protein